MSKAPAMPMYWDAYLADTTHLTTEEHGAYLLLLAAMWRRNGAVPDSDKDNARIVGLTQPKWRKMKARLAATIDGLDIKDGWITQKKLRKIWENTQEKIQKNRSNGALGGRTKANRNNAQALANGSNSLKRKATIPDPEPDPEPDITTSTSLEGSRDHDTQARDPAGDQRDTRTHPQHPPGDIRATRTNGTAPGFDPAALERDSARRISEFVERASGGHQRPTQPRDPWDEAEARLRAKGFR